MARLVCKYERISAGNEVGLLESVLIPLAAGCMGSLSQQASEQTGWSDLWPEVWQVSTFSMLSIPTPFLWPSSQLRPTTWPISLAGKNRHFISPSFSCSSCSALNFGHKRSPSSFTLIELLLLLYKAARVKARSNSKQKKEAVDNPLPNSFILLT